jgi:hypothetical protein
MRCVQMSVEKDLELSVIKMGKEVWIQIYPTHMVVYTLAMSCGRIPGRLLGTEVADLETYCMRIVIVR